MKREINKMKTNSARIRRFTSEDGIEVGTAVGTEGGMEVGTLAWGNKRVGDNRVVGNRGVDSRGVGDSRTGVGSMACRVEVEARTSE